MLGLILGAVITDTLLSARGVGRLEEALDAIPRPETDQEVKLCERPVQEIKELWDGYFLLFSISLPREHAARVEEELSDLIGSVEGGNAAEVLLALENLAEVFSQMKRAVLPSLSYIL